MKKIRKIDKKQGKVRNSMGPGRQEETGKCPMEI
jgi:hypothetical protein